MGFFTFKYSQSDSELEKALQGLQFCGDLNFRYTGCGKDKDKITVPPVYLLPVDVHDNNIYGYFSIDGKLGEVQLGFSRKKNFLSKEYFKLNVNGLPIGEKRAENRLYLPLKLTDLLLNLVTIDNGKEIPTEGFPFSAFGVEGLRGRYPLILVSETEDRIICKGLYQTKEGQLSSYNHATPDRAIRNFLQTLRGVKTNVASHSLDDYKINTVNVSKKVN